MDEQEYSQLLDQEQLQMLVDAGGDDSYDLFGEILDLYLQESHAKIDEIRAYRDSGNFEEMSLSAHALAGCSANIGARKVWQLAKRIEDLTKNGGGMEAGNLIDELVSAHSTSVESLKEFGRQGSGACD